MGRSLKVAAIQMRSGIDLAANRDDFAAAVEAAAAQGASYVQTPEMTGLVQKDGAALLEAIFPEDEDPIVAAAADLAARHGIWLHVGSTPIDRGDGKVANRAFLFGPDGEKKGCYDKIHMFDVDLDSGERWRESAIYEAGDKAWVIRAGSARLGLAICYDVRFPALFREQALSGAQILTAPAAFTRQTGEAHWHVLLRARAIENGAFVIAAAQGGRHADGRETYGHTLIVDPWGRVVAEKADDKPGAIFAELDLDDVESARAKIPNLKNSRPFNLRAGQ
ncbi:carbon-nitrogen hydrolase family protein [Oricola cellulosilytica]|uniref:Carbon-nitrogen hydrolase family protein n=1 Tax=Oricola cellulosilytica TaxID=1429082 RepID=A0A4R0P951_9HYPH|nr:carbon-nitrogen hydrolase family protein [Oricola cellulosilytica]TCD13710.1 carbon-nitrogen hydrolase family protein [Oricola cellulosilytica]